MERLKTLPRYRKALLIALAVLLLGFTMVYAITTRRMGYSYLNRILTPASQGETTVYFGKVQGKTATFAVHSERKTVDFTCGDKIYGPYRVVEDKSYIPEAYADWGNAIGVELWDGETVIFRGCVVSTYDGMLYLGDEEFDTVMKITYGVNGMEYDSDGNPIDPMEPNAYTILELLYGLELTHKGQWGVFFLAVVLSAGLAVSILFAEDLFWLKLSFQLNDPGDAMPSDWTLAMWNIGWTVCFGGILILYLVGLW